MLIFVVGFLIAIFWCACSFAMAVRIALGMPAEPRWSKMDILIIALGPIGVFISFFASFLYFIG